MSWREDLHPRDARGRFAHKGAAPAVSIKATLAALPAASDDDLLDVYHRLSAARKLDHRSLHAIDVELARREEVAKLPLPELTAEQRKVDDLLRRGWSYADAYADAYGRSAGRVRTDQEAALVGRRTGETAEGARRRAYAEIVALEALQAEEATSGVLLAKQCLGIDPAVLWSAPAPRARRCASEELKRWWESNGGRKTYADFKATLAGGRRVSGANERDFGL